MKKLQFLIASAVTSITALTLSGTVFAWHPQGTISKSVQDNTSMSAVSTETTGKDALLVAPGDTLVYTVTVGNIAQPAANNNNDMANTIMTDTLPDGVQLISNPSERVLTEEMGTIAPGDSITKQYAVKVTSKTEDQIITNKACFTGNSLANDNPQSGCSIVAVKVHIPVVAAYGCDLLSLSQGDNRTVTITKLTTTATNGATFKDVAIDWGDSSTELTTSSPLSQNHQYTVDGTYKVVATAHFLVNNQEETATSNGCTQTVTFTTPQVPPAQLPNTGTGSFVIPIALTCITGYGLYLANLKRRVTKN